MKIIRVGVDLSKSVFQVHGVPQQRDNVAVEMPRVRVAENKLHCSLKIGACGDGSC